MNAISTDWRQFADAGLYTVSMAARLVAAQKSKVRSWVEGYASSHAQPIIQRELPKVGGKTVLGFLDLIETAFIRHFTALGYSPQTIRKVADKLRQKHSVDHPFAMGKRFRADGKSIFEEIVDEDGERALVNVMSDQFMIVPAIEPSLFDQILYVDDIARKWTPLPNTPRVIIDPLVAFGKPTLRERGIPTELLYHDFLLVGDAEEVADEYRIDTKDVEEAVAFELELNRLSLH